MIQLLHYRSSSSSVKRLGPEGRSTGSSRSGSGPPKRAHTTPEQEKEAALQKVSQFMNPQPPAKDAPAQAVRVERKPMEPAEDRKPAEPVDESLIRRKVVSIIDELVNNSDFKVCLSCMQCIAILELPWRASTTIIWLNLSNCRV